MLNWINYEKENFKNQIIENDLIDKELLFKMEDKEKNQIKHHTGTAHINSSNGLICVVGGRFLFDFSYMNIIAFADITDLVDT